MEYIKGLIKLFLKTAFGFAILVLLYAAVRHNVEKGIIIGISGGVLIGLATVFICVFFDTIGRGLVFLKYGIFRYNVREERSFKALIKHGDMLKKCEYAIRKLNEVTHVLVDADNNKITAVCGRTWRSQGEKIEMLVSSQGKDSSIVIQSRPLRKAVIFNGGKHFENVEVISRQLISEGVMAINAE